VHFHLIARPSDDRLFVTLGAGDSTGEPLPSIIEGYWMGLSKRSIQIP